jgi:hypothetical protein
VVSCLRSRAVKRLDQMVPKSSVSLELYGHPQAQDVEVLMREHLLYVADWKEEERLVDWMILDLYLSNIVVVSIPHLWHETLA